MDHVGKIWRDPHDTFDPVPFQCGNCDHMVWKGCRNFEQFCFQFMLNVIFLDGIPHFHNCRTDGKTVKGIFDHKFPCSHGSQQIVYGGFVETGGFNDLIESHPLRF